MPNGARSKVPALGTRLGSDIAKLPPQVPNSVVELASGHGPRQARGRRAARAAGLLEARSGRADADVLTEDATDFDDGLGVSLNAVVRADDFLGGDVIEVRTAVGDDTVGGLVHSGGPHRPDDRM